MHLPKRFTKVVALVATATLFAAACAPGEEAPDDADPAEETTDTDTDTDDADAAPDTDRDQIIIDIFFDGQESAIDPHRAAAPSDRTVFRPVYDTLVTFPTPDISEPQPWLATDWEANEDATEWTFNLREGVNFASGNPLTADDVVWSLNRLKFIGDRASFVMEGLTPRAEDDLTVVIESETTNTAVPFILTSSNAAIMDSQLMEENGGVGDESAATDDDAGSFLSANSAGSGPYQLERFDPAAEVVLSVNPEWWGSAPAYEQIVLRDAAPSVQRLNIQSGEADVVTDLGTEEIAGLDEAAFQIQPGAGTNVWVLVFNLDPDVSEATANEDFREAMKYAIDFDFLAEVGGENASQSCGFILPSITGAIDPDDPACLSQDLDRAREALERSGLGDDIEVTFILQDFDRDGVSAVDLGSRISQMWGEVGVSATIQEQPDAVVADARNSGQIEVFVVPNSIRFPHPAGYVGSMNPSGGTSQAGEDYRGGWMASDDPNLAHPPIDGQDEVAAIGRDAISAPSIEEAVPLFQEWERAMIETSPFIPLVVGSATLVAQTDLPNIDEFHPLWAIDIPTFAGATAN